MNDQKRIQELEERLHHLTQELKHSRQAEKDLQDRERRHLGILENMEEAYFELDLSGNFTFFNTASVELFGYPADQMMGMNYRQYVSEETADRLCRIYNGIFSTGKPEKSIIYEIIRQDGTKRQLEISTSLKRDLEGQALGFSSIGRDITERINTEKALRESEEIFSTAFRYSPNSVTISSLDDGHYLLVNEGFSRITGYSREEAVEKTSVEQSLWTDPKDRVRIIQSLEQNGSANNMEFTFRRKNGELMPGLVSGEIITLKDRRCLLLLVIDMTEQKKARREMRRLRILLSNIINSMPSILIGVDSQGSVTQWNQKAEMVTGLPVEKAQGEPLAQVFPRLKDELEKVQLAVCNREVQQELKKEVWYNGDKRFEDITVYPLIDLGVEGAVIRLDDVTEHVRMEDLMIQTEKMMSVGGLAAGMAHEINNPLGSIMQGAQNIVRRFSPELKANLEAAETCGIDLNQIQTYMKERRIDNMLHGIREAGERMSKIISNMLQFSRKSESKFAPIDLGDLLDRTAELAGSDYDLKKKYDFRHIEIVRRYDSNLKPVMCTETEIEQVFLNILRNAAQAMVETEESVSPRLVIRTAIDGEMAKVEIEDNGPGMEESVRRRVFEPFFTTKPVGTGTGLGLSVSYMIVTHNHNGTMEAESKPDGGSRFIVKLPLDRNS
ncbi:MAG: PAS domain S-box protein [Proteobacteria bacterium]|nr:PAS domain S-box protein [Pseudomonadota bacterium]